MKKIHIVCKKKKDDAIRLARKIIDEFGKNNDIYLDEESARFIRYEKQIEIEHIGKNANFIIVLGETVPC